MPTYPHAAMGHCRYCQQPVFGWQEPIYENSQVVAHGACWLWDRWKPRYGVLEIPPYK